MTLSYRLKQFKYWAKMLSGKSYYHQPVTVGRVFVPGKLEGYFTDKTGKAALTGSVDENGIPYPKLTNGQRVYFPIMIAQKALAHWDLWLMHNNENDRKQFLWLADWFIEHQDDKGGWDTLSHRGVEDQYKYSAMTQGQALSVLARAYKLTDEGIYKQSCQNAFEFITKPVQDGGVCVYEDEAIFLEEFPGKRRDTVLNGWVSSLMGVYDYSIQFDDDAARRFFETSLNTLITRLQEYDTGYWSYYSNATKRLASPYYHQVHIAQLEALSQINEHPLLAERLQRWKRYSRNYIYKLLAIGRKGVQKLREPALPTILE